jgi:hypothetical protein
MLHECSLKPFASAAQNVSPQYTVYCIGRFACTCCLPYMETHSEHTHTHTHTHTAHSHARIRTFTQHDSNMSIHTWSSVMICPKHSVRSEIVSNVMACLQTTLRYIPTYTHPCMRMHIQGSAPHYVWLPGRDPDSQTCMCTHKHTYGHS